MVIKFVRKMSLPVPSTASALSRSLGWRPVSHGRIKRPLPLVLWQFYLSKQSGYQHSGQERVLNYAQATRSATPGRWLADALVALSIESLAHVGFSNFPFREKEMFWLIRFLLNIVLSFRWSARWNISLTREFMYKLTIKWIQYCFLYFSDKFMLYIK